ncbi:MAG: hypothetical protein ABFD76_15475 [Smithella sp.]
MVAVNIGVDLPQDRKSQINFALALYAIWGAERPPVCEKCGGIKDQEQAKTRRCLCEEPQDTSYESP